ncbi:MAG TPA: GAF domain-containing protein, partial [Burkholderiaceae bacterium]|nr:GAF domain-containing protein [Burkholderiaceae bacterium]
MAELEYQHAQAATLSDELRLYRLLEGTTQALWRADADGKVSRHSPSWSAFTGQSPAQQRGWGWLDAVEAGDRGRLQSALLSALAAREPFRCQQGLRRADGGSVYTLLAAVPILDGDGRVLEWFGALTDISDRRWSESLLETQNQALEALAAGGPLPGVLDFVARGVEAQLGRGARCSILLVEDRRLFAGAAPHLPAEYMAAIEGLAIGPGVGSCGHAAYTREIMVVDDIATHPNWEGGRQVALEHGLRSCWSTPILSPAREVLGVFAVYNDRPYHPGPRDLQVADAAAHIAGIAIERHRSDEALRAHNQALLEVDRRKDVFLAMLAHELRNPLAPLQTAQHLLDAHSDPATISRLREIISRQTRQLTRLVDDLLDV